MSYFDYLEDGELFSVCDESAEDMVYRSIAVEVRPQVEYINYQQSPAIYNLSSFNKTSVSMGNKLMTNSGSVSTGCPSVPFGMAKTNFIITMADRRMVIESISDHLKTQSNYDFSYIESDFMVRMSVWFSILRPHV